MPAKVSPKSPVGSERVQVREGVLDLPRPLPLEYGGRVVDGRLAYQLAGVPDAPVIAVLGGISADRVVSPREGESDRGWWEWMVGEGRPLDLGAYRVLSIDYLFGRGESSGQVVDAPSGTEGPLAIPLVTPTDQAGSLALALEVLGIESLCGVIGASYGGAIAFAFAAAHPDRAARAMVIGAAHRSHPLATAVRVVQRRIVQRGIAHGDGSGGLALARALAMTTYRSDVEFEERFSASPTIDAAGVRFPVEDYIDHHGDTFAQRFTARHFLCLSQSSDLHDVDPDRVRVPVTLVSTDPDVLAPRWQMEALARRMGDPHRLVRVDSLHGHDAFLTDRDVFSRIVAEFVASCGEDA